MLAAGANTASQRNADQKELAHFNSLAERWWDPQGPSKPLLAINPVRFDFVVAELKKTGRELKDSRVLDLGCGGGILSESLARAGAHVTGLDLSAELLEVAKLHALGEGLSIDYVLQDSRHYSAQHAGEFDLICCMEMLEHVPDPRAILQDIHALLKPGGLAVLSTLDRTPKSFALGILAAECLLRLVPRGTHHYQQFIRPDELAAALRAVDLDLVNMAGIDYQPWSNHARLTDRIRVNYLMSAIK
jgi:2-polyprenyl-6-hydroxyphenyl methylase / 3-demethylubiquinone-9 3-methyltransferase